MQIRYPLLLPIIGHGATDIVDLPFETIHIHFWSAILVYVLKENQRRILLILSSIIHISRDFPNKNRLLISAGLHKLWLSKPIIAKLYLLLIHTPSHYLRNFTLSTNQKFIWKTIFSFTTTVCAFFGLKNDIDIKSEKKFGKYWWTAPILGHIILNEKINNINAKRYNNLFNNYKKIYLI